MKQGAAIRCSLFIELSTTTDRDIAVSEYLAATRLKLQATRFPLGREMFRF
jgi:hypothetical protein